MFSFIQSTVQAEGRIRTFLFRGKRGRCKPTERCLVQSLTAARRDISMEVNANPLISYVKVKFNQHQLFCVICCTLLEVVHFMCNTLHMLTDELSALIIARRKARGWTQAHLAALASISRRTMISVEDGKHDIGIRKLERILNAIGMTLTATEQKRRPIEGELHEFFREDE